MFGLQIIEKLAKLILCLVCKEQQAKKKVLIMKIFRDEILNYYQLSILPSKDFDIVCRNQTSVAIVSPQQPATAPAHIY